MPSSKVISPGHSYRPGYHRRISHPSRNTKENGETIEMIKARLADLLEGFVNGTCGKGEWDAFLSVRHEDPDVEKIRDHCELLDIEFPARKLGQFCSEEGGKVLLNYARRLREESTS